MAYSVSAVAVSVWHIGFFLQTLCCGKVDILAISRGDSQARALRYRGTVEPVTP